MDLRFTPEEERFRAEARAWLEANRSEHEPPEHDLEARKTFDMAWQRRLFDAGYAGISWPKEFGGRGATLIEQAIFSSEMARADAPASGLRARLRGGLGSASDARIEAQIRLLNDSGRDVPLSELTLRYWYTDETTPSAQVFELGAATDESNDRTIRADRITSSFARVDRPKADRYVEVGFTSRAGKVRAESGVALDFTVRPQGRGRYDESNDYSYRRAPREADWKRVTLYRHGTLVWGTEP